MLLAAVKKRFEEVCTSTQEAARKVTPRQKKIAAIAATILTALGSAIYFLRKGEAPSHQNPVGAPKIPPKLPLCNLDDGPKSPRGFSFPTSEPNLINEFFENFSEEDFHKHIFGVLPEKNELIRPERLIGGEVTSANRDNQLQSAIPDEILYDYFEEFYKAQGNPTNRLETESSFKAAANSYIQSMVQCVTNGVSQFFSLFSSPVKNPAGSSTEPPYRENNTCIPADRLEEEFLDKGTSSLQGNLEASIRYPEPPFLQKNYPIDYVYLKDDAPLETSFLPYLTKLREWIDRFFTPKNEPQFFDASRFSRAIAKIEQQPPHKDLPQCGLDQTNPYYTTPDQIQFAIGSQSQRNKDLPQDDVCNPKEMQLATIKPNVANLLPTEHSGKHIDLPVETTSKILSTANNTQNSREPSRNFIGEEAWIKQQQRTSHRGA